MAVDLFDFSGQVAFVSGASRGLGEHFAEVLAKAGCDVVVTSRKKESLQLVQDRIEGLGRKCLAVEMDVTDTASIEAAVDEARATFPRIQILVNNAGCNVRKPALEVTPEDWDLILDTNLRGSFFLSQAIVKKSMLEYGYGRIVNIGSVTSVHGYGGLAPYGASRGGIRQMTMSLADDWGPHGPVAKPSVMRGEKSTGKDPPPLTPGPAASRGGGPPVLHRPREKPIFLWFL